jgi:hypothetical protein
VRLRRRRQPLPLKPEELEVDWTPFLDGRAHRLKRRRHFPDVDPSVARKAAQLAAAAMGRAVVTIPDRSLPEKYIWVQFADGKIVAGTPCACGSRRLARLNGDFVRCTECKAQLLLTEEAEERESRSVRLLRKLRDVHLERREQRGSSVLYRGWALEEGERVFVLVRLRADEGEDGDGARVEQRDVYERLRDVRVVPFAQFEDLIDGESRELLSSWSDDPREWDIVFANAPEPDGVEDDELALVDA